MFVDPRVCAQGWILQVLASELLGNDSAVRLPLG